MEDALRQIALKDGRYSPEAFKFLFESLEYAIHLSGKGESEGTARHVTGQEVLEGMREYALRLFGPLSGQVWNQWGVESTLDWGHMVFLLVDAGMLNRQESDSVEDFRAGYDFEEAFVRSYRPEVPAQLED